jgi:hypothetical protein
VPLKPEEVTLAYQLLLNRQPSDQEVTNVSGRHDNIQALRNMFLHSEEFKMGYAKILDRQLHRAEPTLIHIHIPKAAGTSLAKALEAENQLQPNRIIHHGNRAELLKQSREARLKLRYIRGHLFMGVGEYFDVPHRYLCILRKPGPRIYSFYQFVSRTNTHPMFKILREKNMNFGDYLEATMTNGMSRGEVDNGQVRRISGYHTTGGFGREAQLLQRAVNNLFAPNVIFGVVEKLGILVDILVAERFLSTSDIEKRNVSPNSEQYEGAVASLNPKQRQIFEKFIAYDTILYGLCEHLVTTSANQKAAPELVLPAKRN